VQYTLVIGERTRTVHLQRQDGGYRVTVDARTFDVHAAEVDGRALSLLIGSTSAQGAGRSVPAVVVPGRTTGELQVAVHGRTVPVQVVADERSRRRGGGPGDASGPQRIIAPMPGKVVRVLVAPGAEVQARQGLVVVEAMKMENELRAARAGRVVSVSVVEGQSVDAGAVLAVVE
jgi:biotin carboxyl carrier protein